MINGKSVLAIILARGGSKGIPGKNIRIIAGKPLIAWSIEAAVKSKYVDRVVVSTDYDDIAKIAEEWGADVPFRRPPELASDTAKSETAILHALAWIKKNEGKSYDYFILLQPTLPLRTHQHIDQALKAFAEHGKANTLISVKSLDGNPYLIRKTNKKGYLEKFLKNPKPTVRRQEVEELCIPNGAIYIAKTNIFLKNQDLYDKCIGYSMDKITSWDIDEDVDLQIADFFLKRS